MNRRLLMVAALITSVAVNLLFFGIILGKKTRTDRPVGPVPLAWTAQNLPPELRQQVRMQMRERQTGAREFRIETRDALQAVREAAMSEPGDAGELKAALARLRAAQGKYQQFLHDSVAEVAADLPREQRIALLVQALGRGEPRDQRRPQPPPER